MARPAPVIPAPDAAAGPVTLQTAGGTLIAAQPLTQVAQLAGRLQQIAVPTAAPPEPGEPTRAEDLAQRARALLLKRADEQLRLLAGLGASGPTRAPAKPAEAPTGSPGAHPTLRLIEEPKSTLDPSRSESIRSLYGVRNTTSGVLFIQPISSGMRLGIAGDFTGWMPIPMRRNDQLGVFELCLPLPPGRRQYRVVIDGRWTADPYNPICEPNPFGELNSIFTAEAAHAGSAPDHRSPAAFTAPAPTAPPTAAAII
ncbi:MAG: hypothetical protein WD749_08475 [Phycisphaerales bacterium]